jgi:DsbC/DsbD-like thiol-disulfide interchange protein
MVRAVTTVVVGIGMAAITAVGSRADGAWIDVPHAKLRLRAASNAEKKSASAVLEVQLASGWKTYWRMPGDAGVPPSFDWAGSENVADVTVHYPAPIGMPDQGGIAVGYKNAVVFPIDVAIKSVGQSSSLKLDFAFGVCRDICIPVEIKLSAPIEPANTVVIADHRAGMAKVPAVVSLADAAKRAPALAAMRADFGGDAPKLIFETRGAEDVFVEAPDGLFVPLARKVAGEAAGAATFEVDLSKLPDVKELPGKRLRLTIVGPAIANRRAIEATWQLPK